MKTNTLTKCILLLVFFMFLEANQFCQSYSPIDPTTIPKFVDPLPHFAAGLRVNARAGGNLTIKALPAQQIALSTGTPLSTGTIGDPYSPNAGKGNYVTYQITYNGVVGPAMWPTQTIEAQVGKPLTVQYQNALTGLTYDHFNIVADQTLMMNGYPQTGNIYTDPYTGPIPMVVHLHGGEVPSNSDGGPTAWFMPDNSRQGPGFALNASSLYTYPNLQESGTLWFHPNEQGLTRINVYTGLTGFYFLRGQDEEVSKLPGWSGDDKVSEITPAGKTTTFNGSNAYLPEIEVAIQDRMFNVKGELFWPIEPTNPDIHPFWGPDFFGNVMTVNGKSWPYLSVAPRTYRFRLLNGCNARFINIWLEKHDGTAGPAIHVVGSDGAFIDNPVTLDPANHKTLTMGPGERYDVIIDFSGFKDEVLTMRNNANSPYPDGDPVLPGLTDQIMQFVVNGLMVGSNPPEPGIDKGVIPENARPVNPMVKLVDFPNGIPTVTPDVKRQIILNEVIGAGGPIQVLFNNSHYDGNTPILGAPPYSGEPTETPREGTTEMIQIINTTPGSHPIHIHLAQMQLVGRQQFDVSKYLAEYSALWAENSNLPEFPSGQGYPGGSGSPLPYDQVNSDNAVGGNPAVTPYLVPGTFRPADQVERLWKDNVISLPGEVLTFMVRYAPTNVPVDAGPDKLLYSFDPSTGPGYVWHSNIIDQKDMDMMRPLLIQPALFRSLISVQPLPKEACSGDTVTYSVTASSINSITYEWQVSVDDGISWTNIMDVAPYAGALTSSLIISPVTVSLSNNQYRCNLYTSGGSVTSNAVLLTVNNCTLTGTVKYNNAAMDPLGGFTVSTGKLSAVTDAAGSFTIEGVTSGVYPIMIKGKTNGLGSSNSTDAGSINTWVSYPSSILNVKYLAGDVDDNHIINSIDANSIQVNFVKAKPFATKPWQFYNATGTGTTNPSPLAVSINGTSVKEFDILGLYTGDFNGSFLHNVVGGTSNVLLTNTGNIIPVIDGEQFNLPLKAAVSGKVGAISLILNVPSALVTVANVTIAGSTIPASFVLNGNELRIGWNSLTPVNTTAGGDLVIISLLPTHKFTATTTMSIGIVADQLNELADANMNPIANSELLVDNAIGQADNSGIVLSAAPNPTTGLTTITYTIQTGGKVFLGVYNSLAKLLLSPLVNNVNQAAGTYTVSGDMSTLTKGTYFLTLTLKSDKNTYVKTITLVIN